MDIEQIKKSLLEDKNFLKELAEKMYLDKLLKKASDKSKNELSDELFSKINKKLGENY